jgi:hypothetical protein
LRTPRRPHYGASLIYAGQISGEIASARDVAALRAVLTRLFERLELRSDRGAELQAELLEGGNRLVWQDAYLKPVPRADAIIPGLHKLGWKPQRVGLGLAAEDARDKDAHSLPSAWVIARISARAT